LLRTVAGLDGSLPKAAFNDGKGGRPTPVEGASHNGMSNSFPKVSPDGRWIVWVKCRNAQLMRPDSQLYIVPAPSGGVARPMRCNTPLMNSWHSFSPNGRWLVFSSKSRSPYTQMYLTHLDEQGNDSPAILIDNSTAANRAVNIPEFVNIPPDELMAISTPAVDIYKEIDRVALERKGDRQGAFEEYRAGQQALRHGELARAEEEFKTVLALDPKLAEARINLGLVYHALGEYSLSASNLTTALRDKPDLAGPTFILGIDYLRLGKTEKGIPVLQRALRMDPSNLEGRRALALCYVSKEDFRQAAKHQAMVSGVIEVGQD
jgi:hypothetical protein